LIDPGVIAHLHATAVVDRLELRPREWIERPPFRTMPSRSLWTVERALAFAAVEACQVSARERHPHDPVAVDVHAARTVAVDRGARLAPRRLVIFGERRGRRIVAGDDAHHPAREAEHRAPDASVVRIKADAVHTGENALVL